MSGPTVLDVVENAPRWRPSIPMSRTDSDSLPRFTASSHLTLTDALAAMGMPTAFGASADFSGMTGQPELFIQTVQHEAVAEVDEQGTQAAAASGGAMAGSHGITITVDRPFLFLIRDEPTGAILFLGRVTDPWTD